MNTIHANTIQANHISVNHISVNGTTSSTLITPNTSLIATIEADLNTLLTLESMEKGIFTFGPSVPPNDEIEALEKEVENARKEVKELEDRLQELKMRNQEFQV